MKYRTFIYHSRPHDVGSRHGLLKLPVNEQGNIKIRRPKYGRYEGYTRTQREERIRYACKPLYTVHHRDVNRRTAFLGAQPMMAKYQYQHMHTRMKRQQKKRNTRCNWPVVHRAPTLLNCLLSFLRFTFCPIYPCRISITKRRPEIPFYLQRCFISFRPCFFLSVLFKHYILSQHLISMLCSLSLAASENTQKEDIWSRCMFMICS